MAVNMTYSSKFKYWLVFWYALIVFFKAVQDTIAFHPDSWLVQLSPSFMHIEQSGGLFNLFRWDGWHLSWFLLFGCVFMCFIYSIKIGWFLPLAKFDWKFYLKIIVIQCILTFMIHFLFFHVIF